MNLNLSVLLIVLFAATEHTLSTITEPPVDGTVILGEDITLQCVSDNAGDLVEWRVFSEPDPIFSTIDGISNPDKYERAGTGTDYSLTVKITLWADGGQYFCSRFSGTTYAVQLVVLGQPSATFGTLIDGQTSQLRCDVTVASDNEANLEEMHLPKLRAYIDGESQEATTYHWIDSGPGQDSPIFMTVNYTAMASHHNKDFTCEVYTEQPDEKVTGSKQMEIHSPACNMVLAPRNQEYKVGAYINCTAEGHPEPAISWNALESAGARPVSGSQLTITEDMLGNDGYNRWECQAINQYITEALKEDIEFTAGVTEPNKAAMTGEGVSVLSVLVCGAWVLVLI